MYQHSQDQQLAKRTHFAQDVLSYDTFRPGYPAALISHIIQRAQLDKKHKILEIGCGTGKATQLFAERGYHLHGLDIAQPMIAYCQEKFRGYEGLSFEQVSFEHWQSQQRYKLVFAATAFHWIPKDQAYMRAAQVLRPQGWLAAFSNVHPLPMSGFHESVQEVYQRVLATENPNDGPTTAEKIQSFKQEWQASGLFQHLEVQQYPWQTRYPIERYLKLLDTYSFQGQLAPTLKVELYEGIREHAERYYAGMVDKPYLTVLLMAQKDSNTA